MTTVDEIREITAKSRARLAKEEAATRQAEHEAEESKRAELKAQIKDLFVPVDRQIKAAAHDGRVSARIYYHSSSFVARSNDQRIWARVITEEAELRGFRVKYGNETSNMGDSAAPCMVEQYWLDISWGK